MAEDRMAVLDTVRKAIADGDPLLAIQQDVQSQHAPPPDGISHMEGCRPNAPSTAFDGPGRSGRPSLDEEVPRAALVPLSPDEV